MKIWYVSDGKAGHKAQMLGLVAALKRQAVEIDWIEIPVEQISIVGLMAYWLSFGYFGQLPKLITDKATITDETTTTNEVTISVEAPDLILGVGHRTHWKVLLLQKIYPNAKTLILMKPSLPLNWFNYLIVPKHDTPPKFSYIFASEGVLNPLINEHRHQISKNLILIGGPSKRHAWSADVVIAQLTQLIKQYPQHTFILTTSRRTPDNFLQHEFFKQFSSRFDIHPIQKTPSGWLFEQLQLAHHVWVTEDSVSMLYEALTAGCAVHVIIMPRLKQDRITAAVDHLLAQKMVSGLTEKQSNSDQAICAQKNTLNEADRAANWLMSHQTG